MFCIENTLVCKNIYTSTPVVARVHNENHKYAEKVCHTGDKESRLSATIGMTKTNEL